MLLPQAPLEVELIYLPTKYLPPALPRYPSSPSSTVSVLTLGLHTSHTSTHTGPYHTNQAYRSTIQYLAPICSLLLAPCSLLLVRHSARFGHTLCYRAIFWKRSLRIDERAATSTASHHPHFQKQVSEMARVKTSCSPVSLVPAPVAHYCSQANIQDPLDNLETYFWLVILPLLQPLTPRLSPNEVYGGNNRNLILNFSILYLVYSWQQAALLSPTKIPALVRR